MRIDIIRTAGYGRKRSCGGRREVRVWRHVGRRKEGIVEGELRLKMYLVAARVMEEGNRNGG